MMLISMMVIKFKSTDTINRIRGRHHFGDNNNIKLQIFFKENNL